MVSQTNNWELNVPCSSEGNYHSNKFPLPDQNKGREDQLLHKHLNFQKLNANPNLNIAFRLWRHTAFLAPWAEDWNRNGTDNF